MRVCQFVLHLFISNALFIICIVVWTASCPMLMLEIIIWSTQENHCCVSLFIGSANSVLSFSKCFCSFVPYFCCGWVLSSLYVFLNMYDICKPKGGKSHVISQKLAQCVNKACILTYLLWAFPVEWILSRVYQK